MRTSSLTGTSTAVRGAIRTPISTQETPTSMSWGSTSTTWIPTPQTRQSTFSALANEPYGLTDFEAFAAAQGKPMSFPEWGLSTVPSGDDPGYIDGMASTVANGDFAFETYFDGAARRRTRWHSGPVRRPFRSPRIKTGSALPHQRRDDLGYRDGRWWR